MLKALFVLEIYKLLSWLFGYAEKRLDKKAKVNFKIYNVTIGQQIITIQILLNVSLSIFFLEKSYTKSGGDAYLWINSLKC